MEKIKIEKNTVQETLIIPLYGRKMCSEKFSALYTDIYAKKLCDRLDYDFSELEKKNNSFLYEFGALEAAMRQLDIIWEIKEYLKIYPKATIVNLGCGLDETGKACDNGSCSIVNVDFPDVINVRNQLISNHEREKNVACDLKDYSWMNEVDGSRALIEFIVNNYREQYAILQVGTGDSPLTIPFYEKCGFVRSHIISNFFTDNYDHPIYESGVQLVDMVYLQRPL